MDEFKNSNYDNDEMNGNLFENNNTQAEENSEVHIFEQSESKQWFADDFEESFRNKVPSDKSMSVYAPKQKKEFGKFFKHPAVVAVMSSLLTCALCFGIFASVYKPNVVYQNVATDSTSSSAAKNMASYSSLENSTKTSASDLTVSQIYEKANTWVVSIICTTQSNSYLQSSAQSSGSGIILSPDGYIVTNNHVIEGAAEIKVNTMTGLNFTAKLIGTDPRTDVAVLKVESDTALPFAELGDSAEIQVGELAVAIGNPLKEELAGTLTVGVISAINRNLEIDGKQMTMLQTDAAINPGNSGGALLNSKGQVIGITTAKSTGIDVEGLGFAIPINEVNPVVKSIKENGYVTGRPLIGVSGVTVTKAISQTYNLPEGIYVKAVGEFSAAERAGVQVGDVIIACQGQKVETIDDLNKIRDSYKAGDTIELEISRNGKNMKVSLTLQEEKPSTKAPSQPQQQVPSQGQQMPFNPSDLFRFFGW